MMRSNFLQALYSRVLLADGAMGTELQRAGLEPGGCGERWNLERPDQVFAIQRAYVDAGADCLTTNTFGASRVMLERHGYGTEVEAINRAGVVQARRAFGARPGFVLGDIGPLGGLIEPYGEITEALAREALTEQASALVEAGVDALVIETQTSLEELGHAVAAAREVGSPCVIASLAFDVTHDAKDLRTMMGVSPEDGARFMSDRGVDVVAINCGSGVDARWAAEAIRRYRRVCDLPAMAQPNAGQPVLENLRVVYKEAPSHMASRLAELLAAGARVVGGCCGTTPQHIRLFRAVVDDWNART